MLTPRIPAPRTAPRAGHYKTRLGNHVLQMLKKLDKREIFEKWVHLTQHSKNQKAQDDLKALKKEGRFEEIVAHHLELFWAQLQ